MKSEAAIVLSLTLTYRVEFGQIVLGSWIEDCVALAPAYGEVDTYARHTRDDE